MGRAKHVNECHFNIIEPVIFEFSTICYPFDYFSCRGVFSWEKREILGSRVEPVSLFSDCLISVGLHAPYFVYILLIS